MKDLIKLIGQVGLINLGGVRVEVRIVDVKMSYGHERYQVEPTAGIGRIWTEQLPFVPEDYQTKFI